LLHRLLEEVSEVVVQAAQAVPLSLLKRFGAVICEDSSTITLPDELAELWQGCGGTQAHTAAAVKVHTRWDLTRGRLWGPKLTAGRTADRRSPLCEHQGLAHALVSFGVAGQGRLRLHRPGCRLRQSRAHLIECSRGTLEERVDILGVVPLQLLPKFRASHGLGCEFD